MDRYRREAHFTMHISVTCWYGVQASYPRDVDGRHFVALQGSGDDFGVFITAGPEGHPSVELYLASGQRPGRDARAMVRALQAMPGWTDAFYLERALGIE